jgi:hypothetical protein
VLGQLAQLVVVAANEARRCTAASGFDQIHGVAVVHIRDQRVRRVQHFLSFPLLDDLGELRLSADLVCRPASVIEQAC